MLSKWVNLGKGYRPRLFVLKDGILSYYRVGSHNTDHAPAGTYMYTYIMSLQFDSGVSSFVEMSLAFRMHQTDSFISRRDAQSAQLPSQH